MTLKHILLLAAGLALVPTAAFADEKAKAPEAATAESKLVCKKESEVGSLVRKKRVCKTQAEWDRLGQASRDAMGQGQMSGGSSGN